MVAAPVAMAGQQPAPGLGAGATPSKRARHAEPVRVDRRVMVHVETNHPTCGPFLCGVLEGDSLQSLLGKTWSSGRGSITVRHHRCRIARA